MKEWEITCWFWYEDSMLDDSFRMTGTEEDAAQFARLANEAAQTEEAQIEIPELGVFVKLINCTYKEVEIGTIG